MELDPNFSPTTPQPVDSGKGNRSFNLWALMAVAAVVAIIVLAGLLIYYLNQYHKAQTTVDQQKAVAATEAKEQQKQVDEAEFAEREKQPYRKYQAPPVLGALSVEFPKTWNVYVSEEEKGQVQLNLFMSPDLVHDAKTSQDPYALRIRMERTLYPNAIENYQKLMKDGDLTAQAVTISGIAGTRFDGKIGNDRTGSVVLLPVRDKTLLIWTESNNYLNDFNLILSKLSISP